MKTFVRRYPAYLCFLLLLGFFLLGCEDSETECAGERGTWSRTADNNGLLKVELPVSVSLIDASALPQVSEIQRKVFCVIDSSYRILNSYQGNAFSRPCFQLMPGQTYYDEFPYSTKTYDVIDPEKFAIYYQSIPPELNSFLEIKVKDFYSNISALRNMDGAFASASPTIPASLWPANYVSQPNYQITDDATQLSLYGLLHNLVLKGNDLYIYIYLPLNIGIKTPAYNGVLMKKERYKTEINHFANPEYRLTPALRQSLDLSAYRPVSLCDGYGYTQIHFPLKITPEMLRQVLVNYKNAVIVYRLNHSDASFADPYAQP